MSHLVLRDRRHGESDESSNVDDVSVGVSQRRRSYETYAVDDSTSEESLRRKRRANTNNFPLNDPINEELDIVATFCGRDANSTRVFGVLFPCRSYPLDASNFTQMDSTHWVLDMSIFIGESYDEVKDICIYLLDEFSIPPEKALALYVQSPGSHFQYCGAVCRACPSAVLSLLWPDVGCKRQLTRPGAAALSAKIGLAVEDLVSLPALNVGKQRQLEILALRVGQNLLSFMQLFPWGLDKFLAPHDALNKWFKKFKEKLSRDTEYTKSLIAGLS